MACIDMARDSPSMVPSHDNKNVLSIDDKYDECWLGWQQKSAKLLNKFMIIRNTIEFNQHTQGTYIVMVQRLIT